MANNWKVLTTIEQFEKIVEDSFAAPQLIFKHSTRCNLSESIYTQLKSWNQVQKLVTIHYLDIIAFRSVSNHIENALNVLHESPQVIILHHGKVHYHESHYRIEGRKIESIFSPETV